MQEPRGKTEYGHAPWPLHLLVFISPFLAGSYSSFKTPHRYPSPNCRSAVNDHLLFALVFSTSHLSGSPVVFPQHVTHLAITALGTCVAIVHVFSGFFFYLRNSLEHARLYQILGRKCSFKFEVVRWNALPPP